LESDEAPRFDRHIQFGIVAWERVIWAVMGARVVVEKATVHARRVAKHT